MAIVGSVDQNHNQIELDRLNGKDCGIGCNLMGLGDWKKSRLGSILSSSLFEVYMNIVWCLNQNYIISYLIISCLIHIVRAGMANIDLTLKWQLSLLVILTPVLRALAHRFLNSNPNLQKVHSFYSQYMSFSLTMRPCRLVSIPSQTEQFSNYLITFWHRTLTPGPGPLLGEENPRWCFAAPFSRAEELHFCVFRDSQTHSTHP